VTALADEASEGMDGPGLAGWFKLLDAELGNVRAALAWRLDAGEAEAAAHTAASLYRFWSGRAHLDEGRRWLGAALELGGISEPTRAEALHYDGLFALLSGDPGAEERLEEALALYRRLGDARGAGRCLDHLGCVAFLGGFFARADGLHREAIEILTGCGDDWGTANACCHQGITLLFSGHPQKAPEPLERCLALMEQIGDPELTEFASISLGLAQLRIGRIDDAERTLTKALAIGVELEDPSGVEFGLETLAALEAVRGDAARAARLHAAAKGLSVERGVTWHDVDADMYRPLLAQVGIDFDAPCRPLAPGASLRETVEAALDEGDGPGRVAEPRPMAEY
jgi:hypothetical protein